MARTAGGEGHAQGRIGPRCGADQARCGGRGVCGAVHGPQLTVRSHMGEISRPRARSRSPCAAAVSGADASRSARFRICSRTADCAADRSAREETASATRRRGRGGRGWAGGGRWCGPGRRTRQRWRGSTGCGCATPAAIPPHQPRDATRLLASRIRRARGMSPARTARASLRGRAPLPLALELRLGSWCQRPHPHSACVRISGVGVRGHTQLAAACTRRHVAAINHADAALNGLAAPRLCWSGDALIVSCV